MPLIDPIKIEGLKALNRGLKRLDKNAPKGLRLAGNKAADLVVAVAKPLVPVGPDKGGHASQSIKAASTRTAARVAAGGNKFPYYPWLDFGGGVGRDKSIRRPFLKEGRYIWKAFADNRSEVQRILEDELTNVIRSAGFEPEK